MTKLFGACLIEAGLINHEQLGLALIKQLESQQRLGQILVYMSFISMDSLIEFLVKKRETEAINFYNEFIDENYRSFPLYWIGNFKILPIGYKEVDGAHKLVVATSQPSNSILADKLMLASGCEIELVYTREENLRRFFRYYKKSDTWSPVLWSCLSVGQLTYFA